MLRKTIKYTDFNGVERSEEFLFNLTKAELVEMEMSEKGGLEKTLERIIEENDSKKIVAIFKDLILKAYGEKSEDGKRFIKSDELTASFAQTDAYSELFMELATSTEAATAFVNGITPKISEPIGN